MTQEERIKQLEEEVARLKGEERKPPSKPWPKWDPTEGMRMPPSALAAMVAAVPDRLMADIVADNRRGLEPRSIIPPEPRPKLQTKGSGFVDPIPLRSPPGIEILDRVMDRQDELDKRSAAAKRVDDAMKSLVVAPPDRRGL